MNNLLEYKGYYAKLDFSADDEIFFGVIEGINDIVSFEGKEINELKTAFHEAVDDYLDICARNNKQPEKAYKGSFNIRIKPELHKKAALIAASRHTSLNQFVESAISDKVDF